MNNSKIDVHDELAQAHVGRFHATLGILLGLLTFFDGYDTFSPAYMIHYVVKPWGLMPSQMGFLVSSGLIGFLIGAGVHGFVADGIGRRATLIGGLWITSIFTLSIALFADSFVSFSILRIFTGLGLGVLLPLSTTYINELAPRRIANTFALWGVALGWALGGTVAGIVGVFLTPTMGWRSLYWVGSLSFILLPFLYFFLPESPKFLFYRGRLEELKEILGRLRPDRIDLYKVSEISIPAIQQKPSITELVKARYRTLSLSIWSASFLSLFCIFGLSAWIPTLMLARGETFSASFGFGALIQAMSFVGALACGYLIDNRGGAQRWLAVWWVSGGLSVIALVFFKTHSANILFCASAGFFIMGAQFVLNNFTADSYDTGIRATAVGAELGIGRFGAVLGPFVGGALQQFYHGPKVMLWVIGFAATAAACAILCASRQDASELT